MKIKSARCIGLLTLSLFALPPSYATNGYFSHGTGIKNKSMAGAGVALPQDALAGATNPAGMAFVGDRFDIGATLFFPDRDYSSSNSLLNGNMGAFTIGPDSQISDDKWFVLPSFNINKEISNRTSIGLSPSTFVQFISRSSSCGSSEPSASRMITPGHYP